MYMVTAKNLLFTLSSVNFCNVSNDRS